MLHNNIKETHKEKAEQHFFILCVVLPTQHSMILLYIMPYSITLEYEVKKTLQLVRHEVYSHRQKSVVWPKAFAVKHTGVYLVSPLQTPGLAPVLLWIGEVQPQHNSRRAAVFWF